MNHTCMSRAPQALQDGRNGYRFGSRFPEISVPKVGGTSGTDRRSRSSRIWKCPPVEKVVPRDFWAWAAAHLKELLELYKMSHGARDSVADSWRFP